MLLPRDKDSVPIGLPRVLYLNGRCDYN